MQHRSFLCVLCVLCGFLLFNDSARGQFVVHPDEPIGPPLVGFGAEMNPYEYCTPNWGVVNEENARDYEKKVIDFAPQHVFADAASHLRPIPQPIVTWSCYAGPSPVAQWNRCTFGPA